MISKKSIEAKYRRSGVLPERTWLWVDMPENERHEVGKYVHLQENEFNIICFYGLPGYILLFTTQRIVIVRDGKVDSYSYTLMQEVKLDEVFTAQKTKEDNDTINIILKSGDHLDVIVEKGTWHILYSILKLVISQVD